MRRFARTLALATLAGCSSTSDSVDGIVVNFERLPPWGAKLFLVGGREALVHSDGVFHASGVRTPYDVAVIEDGGDATLWRGLSTRSPAIHVGLVSSVVWLPAGGSIQGVVSGGLGFPSPDGFTHTSAVFDAPRSNSWSGWGGVSGDGTFVTGGSWYGSIPMEGTLHVMQWRAVGNELTWLGHTAQEATLFPGDVLENWRVDLGPVDSAKVEVAISWPPQLGDPEVSAGLAGRSGWVVKEWFSTDLRELPVPIDAGLRARVQVQAYEPAAGWSAAWRHLEAGSPPSEIRVAEPPELLAPADWATGVRRDDRLEWTASSRSVYRVWVYGAAGGPNSYTVFTADNVLPLASLDDVMPLPRGEALRWQVTALAPFGSIDDLASWQAGQAGLAVAGLWGNPWEDADAATGVARTFTMAP